MNKSELLSMFAACALFSGFAVVVLIKLTGGF